MARDKTEDSPDGRPRNPAAERNKEPIREVLAGVLPQQGTVLEIASGTGVHVLHFATHMPQLTWQPSEADAELRDLMATAIQAEAPANVRPPLTLDVRQSAWPLDHADAILCINLTHVAPWAATEGLFAGAARTLAAGGVVVLYGPFRRGGEHTAESNRDFDEALRARNAEWGLRDVEAVSATAQAHGFELHDIVEMPANNLCLVLARAG